jgi:hypothetical protein
MPRSPAQWGAKLAEIDRIANFPLQKESLENAGRHRVMITDQKPLAAAARGSIRLPINPDGRSAGGSS